MIPSLDTLHILRSLGYTGNAFVGHDPDEDGTYISIRDTEGTGSNPKWLRDEKAIQVRSKADKFNYVGGYNELEEVKKLLFGVETIPVEYVETDEGDAVRIDGKVYQKGEEISATVESVTRTIDYIRYLVAGDISFISLDDNSRPIHTINFTITRDYREAYGNREPIR